MPVDKTSPQQGSAPLSSDRRTAQALSLQVGPFGIAVVTLLTFAVVLNLQRLLRLVPLYRGMYREFGFVVPESIRNLLQLGLVAAALWLVHRMGLRDSARELRISPWNARAALFGFAASLPLLVGAAATRNLASPPVHNLVFLALFAPFVEEVHARAFTVTQLHWRAGWPLPVVIAVVAAANGLAHMGQVRGFAEIFGLFALTAVGGGVFAWLFVRWQSIWMPLTLHACGNLWWEIFSVGTTALGGWFPLALQLSSLAVSATLTLRFGPRVGRSSSAAA